MNIFVPLHQINNPWEDYGASSFFAQDTEPDTQPEDASQGIPVSAGMYQQETAQPFDKIQRRLAQNREAARKSRLRKKAYVKQLEMSRLKLVRLEQELTQAKLQGVGANGGLYHQSFGNFNKGISSFEIDYRHWLEEHRRQISELRDALNNNNQPNESELGMLVEDGMCHYAELFHMKAMAAEADIFYLMSGMWETPAEQFLSWIGGFRPSEILKVIVPQIESLTDQQVMNLSCLKQSCQQAEDALTQGMGRLHQILTDAVTAGPQSCVPQTEVATDKWKDLESFIKQADHLRRETLRQMSQILTTHQVAQGLLVLGDYSQQLRSLSKLWATHRF